MNWQQPAALAVVAATAAAMLWKPLRRRFGPRKWRLEKALPCGCAGTGGPPPPGLVISGRRGQKPQVRMTAPASRGA